MSESAKETLNLMLSFGVGSCLEEGAEIFYAPIFNTDHLGRVTDLLIARFKRNQLDELKFRLAMDNSVTYVFNNKKVQKSAGKQLLLECGVDGKNLAIGVGFNLREDLDIEGGQFLDRVHASAPQTDFEKVISSLQNISDRLVLKYQPHSKRLEIIIKMGLGSDPVQTQATKCELVIIGEEIEEPSDNDKVYVNLGDLDYSTLLREDRSFRDKVMIVPSSSPISTGNEEAVISGVTEYIDQGIVTVVGDGSTHSDYPMPPAPEVVSLANLLNLLKTPEFEEGGFELSAAGTVGNFEEDSIDLLLKNTEKQIQLMDTTLLPSKAREWVGGQIGSVISEKLMLNEKIKEIFRAARLKEYDFRRKVHDLEQKLKLKEFDLKRKAKDLLNIQGHLENRQENVASSKGIFLEKMLNTAKSENAQLRERLDEMRFHLKEMQSSSKSRLGIDSDYSELKIKNERILQQAEELKRVNRQLMERLTSSKQGQSVVQGNADEIKRRFETALKVASTLKTEVDRLRNEAIGFKAQENKTNIELIRLKQLLAYYRKKQQP